MCYCESVKNITVAVDDEVYRQARLKAAEANTSVSALVKKYFNSLIGSEADFKRRKRLERETISQIKSFRAGDRLPREEAHSRHAVS